MSGAPGDLPVVATWTLTLAAVEPGNTATIELRGKADGNTVPELYTGAEGMTFVYPDGTRTIYFASNLLCATYTPTRSET